jgi:hypothetical protein
MAAATRKLRHLVWPPARTIDLTATDDETIDVTEEPEPADAAADPAADPDSVDADSDT